MDFPANTAFFYSGQGRAADCRARPRFVSSPHVGVQRRAACRREGAERGVDWALDDPEAVHPYYRGEVHLTEDCALVTGADKVFVMLGINDLGLYGIDDTLKNFKTLLLNINSKSPGAKIYVQSVTPMIDGKEYESLPNEMIREFNSKLKAACDASEIPYLDIYGVVADEEGFLARLANQTDGAAEPLRCEELYLAWPEEGKP